MKKATPLLVSLIAFSLNSAQASSASWKLNAASGNWTTNANWTTTHPQAVNEIATFPNTSSAGARGVVLDAPKTIGKINFQNTTGTPYTLSTAAPTTNFLTLDVTSGNTFIGSGGSSNEVKSILIPIKLMDSLDVGLEGTGQLTLSGPISEGSTGLALSYNASNAVNNTTATTILSLTGVNTYTGATTIKQGLMRYDANGAIHPSSPVIVGDTAGAAGTANLTINTPMTLVNALGVTINSDGRLEQAGSNTIYLKSLNGTASTGSVKLGSGLVEVMGGVTSVFAGTITDGVLEPYFYNPMNTGSRLIASGAGTRLELRGNNTYVARTYVTDDAVVSIQSNTALGPPAGSAYYYGNEGLAQNGGTFELKKISSDLTVNKRFLIYGLGSGGSAGAIHNVLGNNTICDTLTLGWAGAPVPSSSTSINVDSGSCLTIDAQVTGFSGVNLIKYGPGDLIYTGSFDNDYPGLTTIETGRLILNKAGMPFNGPPFGITGDVIINGTGLTAATQGTLLTQQINQLNNNTNLTINGTGKYLLNGFTDTINSLTFNSGTLTQGGNNRLSLQSAGTALNLTTGNDITEGLNITGPIGGGIISVTGSSASNIATASGSTLNLGSFDRQINVTNTAGILNVGSGALGGSTGFTFTKTGPGKLNLAGTNTFSLPATDVSTINAGTVSLSGSFAGNFLINPAGTLSESAANRFNNSATVVTLAGGSYLMNGFADTIGTFNFGSGLLDEGAVGALLSLSSPSTTIPALRITGGANTLTGQGFNITSSAPGSGIVQFVANGPLNSTIDKLNLGALLREINVDDGGDANDLIIKVGMGAGFNKTGLGVLQIPTGGSHTYTNTSAVNAGVLVVDGTLTGPTTALNVGSSATLTGYGTIVGNISINNGGNLNPGSLTGIGTLNVTGSASFQPGSTFHANFAPDPSPKDLLNTTGPVTIGSNVTIDLLPLDVPYPGAFDYTLITSATSVTGTFLVPANVAPGTQYSSATFENTVTYPDGKSVHLHQVILGIGDVITDPDGGPIGDYIDTLTPGPGTDLGNFITNLHLATAPQLADALNQLSPAMLKGLALVQESNAIGVRSQAQNRGLSASKKICKSDKKEPEASHIWVDLGGKYYDQHAIGNYVGFDSTSFSALVGVDHQPNDHLLIGAATGYSHSDLNWRNGKGKGSINSGYALAYAHGYSNTAFIDLVALGALSHYRESRQMHFNMGTMPATLYDRTATASFNGPEFLGHIGTGFIWTSSNVEIRPFISLDYLALHHEKFEEQGANSLNLYVDSSNYTMLRGETGVNFSLCLPTKERKTSLGGKLSYIREERFAGANYTARFENTANSFTIQGMNPDRNLFSPALSLSSSSEDASNTLSLRYEGEFGKGHSDQGLHLEWLTRF